MIVLLLCVCELGPRRGATLIGTEPEPGTSLMVKGVRAWHGNPTHRIRKGTRGYSVKRRTGGL